MEYDIEITETLRRRMRVEARSAGEAVEQAKRLHQLGSVVLDAGDFTGVEFGLCGREYYKSSARDFLLAHGDCFRLLRDFDFRFDMIFADPPYFLSGGGISCQAGKVVCVDKGEWDKPLSPEGVKDFNREWLRLCRDKLKDGGTVWVSGTYHNIFAVADCLTELGYRILNVVTWQKTNPPANISCRFFTYSTEFVIWARKMKKVPHTYNYALMKRLNEGRQMTDVWRLPAIGRWEKSCGKHPTQKPLSLLVRAVLACTEPGAWVLDPFAGSCTTGIAANLCGRRFCGIELEEEFCAMGRARRVELDDGKRRRELAGRIADLRTLSAEGIPPEAATLADGPSQPAQPDGRAADRLAEEGLPYGDPLPF